MMKTLKYIALGAALAEALRMDGDDSKPVEGVRPSPSEATTVADTDMGGDDSPASNDVDSPVSDDLLAAPATGLQATLNAGAPPVVRQTNIELVGSPSPRTRSPHKRSASDGSDDDARGGNPKKQKTPSPDRQRYYLLSQLKQMSMTQ